MAIPAISFSAMVFVFAIWLYLEVRNVRRIARIIVGCMFPVVLTFSIVEKDILDDVSDNKSGYLLWLAEGFMIDGLESGQEDEVLAAVREAHEADGMLIPIHERARALHTLLHHQLYDGTESESE